MQLVLNENPRCRSSSFPGSSPDFPLSRSTSGRLALHRYPDPASASPAGLDPEGCRWVKVNIRSVGVIVRCGFERKRRQRHLGRWVFLRLTEENLSECSSRFGCGRSSFRYCGKVGHNLLLGSPLERGGGGVNMLDLLFWGEN